MFIHVHVHKRFRNMKQKKKSNGIKNAIVPKNHKKKHRENWFSDFCTQVYPRSVHP